MKALIIDDEHKPAEFLRELIERHCPEIEEVTVYSDPLSAIKHINQHEIDILFSDVEMPHINGLELLDALPLERRPSVIFTTAYSEYAISAFDLAASHYLLKPVDPEKLKEAVARVVNSKANPNNKNNSSNNNISNGQTNEKLLLPEGQDYHVINTNNVIRAQGSGSYTSFHLDSGKSVMVSKRLKIFESQLREPNFFRVHQSHIINVNRVVKYSKTDGGYFLMSDGKEVPVRASLKTEVFKILKKL